MSVQYPLHLYIRVDRPLRAGLLAGAEATGQSVSAFARGILRGSISRDAEAVSVTNAGGSVRQGGEGSR